MGMSGQPAEAVHKARAMWELYSSEACHLDTLEVLCHPFRAVLQQVQESATTDLRNRSPFLAAINLRRLFSSVDVLRQVSIRFMRRLAVAMLLPGENGEFEAAATANSSRHAAIYSQATEAGKIVEAFAALKSELLPAEMEYRLRHKASDGSPASTSFFWGGVNLRGHWWSAPLPPPPSSSVLSGSVASCIYHFMLTCDIPMTRNNDRPPESTSRT